MGEAGFQIASGLSAVLLQHNFLHIFPLSHGKKYNHIGKNIAV